MSMTEPTQTQDAFPPYVRAFRGAGRRDLGLLFLHGFPGQTGKNEDLAEAMCSRTGLNAHVIHYSGLGKSPGKFSFSRSIRESVQLARELIRTEGYERLILVGHSWGGLVALNVMSQFPGLIHKMVLLCPLSRFPGPAAVEAQIMTFVDSQRSAGREYGVQELLDDVQIVLRHHDPRSFVARLAFKPKQVMIIQGTADTVVTPSDTRRFVTQFPIPPELVELNQDHWFPDRDKLAEICERFLTS
jgi:pimeloyl-ACP methyl ester carboxylesterase